MDSPPDSPAREPQARGEKHLIDQGAMHNTGVQPAPKPTSTNGNLTLSAHTTPHNIEAPQPVILAASTETAGRKRHSVFTILFVVLCLYLGVLVVLLPWRDAWTDNSLLEAYPTLRAILASNFTRGVVSGIGVLDLWVGISEALKYRRSGTQDSK